MMSTDTTESIGSSRAVMTPRAAGYAPVRQAAAPPTFPMLQIFGFNFRDVTLEQAANALVDAAECGVRTRVYFVNAHCINIAARNPEYRAALHSADVLFADGAGMALAARLWGKRFVDNVNGTDLFPLICERVVAKGIPIALLGARPGVVTKCAEKLHERYSGLRIVWQGDGYYKKDEQTGIIRAINQSGARILFVAKGVPLQEKWIDDNSSHLNVPVILGVGALFDFVSGTIPRAPQLMRRMKLEWLFRLMLEPKRLFKRYVIGNPLFICRAVKERLLGRNGAKHTCSDSSLNS